MLEHCNHPTESWTFFSSTGNGLLSATLPFHPVYSIPSIPLFRSLLPSIPSTPRLSFIHIKSCTSHYNITHLNHIPRTSWMGVFDPLTLRKTWRGWKKLELPPSLTYSECTSGRTSSRYRVRYATVYYAMLFHGMIWHVHTYYCVSSALLYFIVLYCIKWNTMQIISHSRWSIPYYI